MSKNINVRVRDLIDRFGIKEYWVNIYLNKRTGCQYAGIPRPERELTDFDAAMAPPYTVRIYRVHVQRRTEPKS